MDSEENDLVQRLHAKGVPMDSVWQEFDLTEPDLLAIIDVLRETNAREYNPHRHALAMRIHLPPKVARRHWGELRGLYIGELNESMREQLAANLAQAVTRDRLRDLDELLSDESLGNSRSLLTSALKRIRSEPAKSLIDKYRDHPLYAPNLTGRLLKAKETPPATAGRDTLSVVVADAESETIITTEEVARDRNSVLFIARTFEDGLQAFGRNPQDGKLTVKPTEQIVDPSIVRAVESMEAGTITFRNADGAWMWRRFNTQEALSEWLSEYYGVRS